MLELLSDTLSAAQNLLGATLVRQTSQGQMKGIIVETEAYTATDTASHSYRGQTPRNSVMFGPAGYAYVYFTYGMHYCFNIVTGPSGSGEAVLIRALEPIEGLELMAQNRPLKDLSPQNLCNGPAKLCQALSINKQLSGHNLSLPPLQLVAGKPLLQAQIIQTTRIGISRNQDQPWRFYIKGSKFVSKI